MKKILSLLALVLMSCMGAWAAEVTVTSTNQLTDGVKVTIKNISKGQYVSLGSTNVAFSNTATVFTLVGNNTDGFKLYDATNTRYVGGTRGNDYQALTKTDASEAGLFVFASYSSYFSIHCENPEVNTKDPSDPAYEYWGLRNPGLLVTWELGPSLRFEIKIQEPEVSAEEIETLQAKIDNVISATSYSRIGYPKYTCESVIRLTSYISFLGNPKVNAENYASALAAYNEVLAETDVVLPKDGKAYTIKAVTVNADGSIDQSFQLYTDNNGVLKCAANGAAATTNTKFIAKAMDGNKTVLVNERGEYMIWTCDDNTKALNTEGFTTEYDAQRNPLTIIHANRTMTGTNANVTNLTDAQLFGKLEIGGLGKSTSESWYLIYDSANGTGKFVAGTKGQKYYKTSSNHTFLFQFEEATFPYTTKTLNDGGDGNKYYATVALPYAMTIPTGVKAYAASATGDVLTLTEAVSPVAKGAYILVGTSAGSVDVLPAAANPAAVANELQGSITTAPAGDIYVLNKDEDGVGFFKFDTAADYSTLLGKAYLPSSAKANKLSFRFDDVVTAISAIEGNSKNVEIFDLQGRRLEKAQKGMNIINGHKVLVK